MQHFAYCNTNALTEPTKMHTEFLEQNNAGDAKGYLQHQLKSINVSNFLPCMLLMSALHKGLFFWYHKDLPYNFSIFCVENQHQFYLLPLKLSPLQWNKKMEMG